MNATRIISALVLASGAGLLLWHQQQQAAPDDAGFIADAEDTITETVSAYMGIDMTSRRYTAALKNPAYASIIALLGSAEARYGIPAGLLVRQAWQESRFNPDAVNEISGAQGLMQFMPPTSNEWHIDPFDAASAADGAGRYMAWLYGKLGSWSLALAGYNWGIGNVIRKGMERAPTETRNYVAQIGADTGLL